MAFNLESIRVSSPDRPPRIVIYGTSGIGKSTFAAAAPKPVFMPTEDGIDALGVPSFPRIKTWQNLADCFYTLVSSEHDFKTVVLDSADWTENILKEQVAADAGLQSYDTTSNKLAYGRGSRAVEEYWRKIVDSFDYLRNAKGMGVVIVAHSQVKRFDDPTTEAYDRYQIDLGKESAAVVTEWADIVLFATRPHVVVEEKVGIGSTKKRAVGQDERVMYTSEAPAFKAKCRWAVPHKLPLSYEALMSEITLAKQRMIETRNKQAA